MTEFMIARTVDDALTAMASGARAIAGGTDLVVAARAGKTDLPNKIVAIDRLELNKIAFGPGDSDSERLRIGALVTHAELMSDEVVVGDYSALADAAALVGSPSTRNVGTLGGNVMNASPAMDSGAPLFVLGAEVDLASINGSRSVAIAELLLGPATTAARSDELCVSVSMPPRPVNSGSAYVRLEYRRAMEIAVVGAAAMVELEPDGSIKTANLALSAVGPTIISVPIAEITKGKFVPDEAAAMELVAKTASQAAAPISDLRASDHYRRHTIGVVAARALRAALVRATGETIAVPVNRSVGIGAAL